MSDFYTLRVYMLTRVKVFELRKIKEHTPTRFMLMDRLRKELEKIDDVKVMRNRAEETKAENEEKKKEQERVAVKRKMIEDQVKEARRHLENRKQVEPKSRKRDATKMMSPLASTPQVFKKMC